MKPEIFSPVAHLGKPEGAGIVETNAAPAGQSESLLAGGTPLPVGRGGVFGHLTGAHK